MKIPFTLINTQTKAPETNQEYSIEVYARADEDDYAKITNPDIYEIGNGEYELTLTVTCTDYARVYIKCEGCYDRRFTIRPDITVPTTSQIASAVWGRTGADTDSRTLTDAAVISTAVWSDTDRSIDLDIPTPAQIAAVVWGRTGQDTTSRTLTNALTTDEIADAVWGRTDANDESRTVTNMVTVGDIANNVWGRTGQDTTSRALTTATLTVDNTTLATAEDIADIPENVWDNNIPRSLTTAEISSELSLATSDDVDDAKDAILEEGANWVTAEGFATPEDIPPRITAGAIAGEILRESNRKAIAATVLTTDVGDMNVVPNGYTLKHLIMASQKSEFVVDNSETVWKITDTRTSNNEPVVIATRTITLNENGGIEKTE